MWWVRSGATQDERRTHMAAVITASRRWIDWAADDGMALAAELLIVSSEKSRSFVDLASPDGAADPPLRRALLIPFRPIYRLNLKNSSAVAVVARATSSKVIPRALAMVSATIRVWAGSHRFPRNGTGAKYRQSVSTMNLFSGICADNSRTATPFLKVTMPVNETRCPRSSTWLACSNVPPKQ